MSSTPVIEGTNMETWVSGIKGRYMIYRNTPAGTSTETVYGGSTFMITPEDRAFNSSKCQPGQDPFSNGVFSPVTLTDDSSPTYKLAESPNRITDDDIDAMIADNDADAVAERVAQIDSVPAITRVISRALEAKCGPGRLAIFRSRLTELDPSVPQPHTTERVQTVETDVAMSPQYVDPLNQSPQTLGANGVFGHQAPTGPDGHPAPQGPESNPAGWAPTR